MDSAIFSNQDIWAFLKEDEAFFSLNPKDKLCSGILKIKSNLVLSGIKTFIQVFEVLLEKEIKSELIQYEGREFQAPETIELDFKLPWSYFIAGERLALNLLHRSSAISTETKKLAQAAYPIKVLNTRKTTPGIRSFEHYAFQVAGGYNHRFNQRDAFMVKDNHKKYFGSLEKAITFFEDKKQFYTPLVVEIHSLDELEVARKLKIKHVMLDNFSIEEIKSAIKRKDWDVTYEVSGGIRLENIHDYKIEGVDAISVGKVTQFPEAVDISLKYE